VSNLLKKEKGFTLIEIVLVMAIAGLILVIVFLAVQGAQKSRRDQQRKTDAARMLGAVEQCASNRQGNYATCVGVGGTELTYFSPHVAPGGGTYNVGAAVGLTTFVVTAGTTCPGAGAASPAAVQVQLEQASSTFCVGN
jgi:prepilin-type N-terminal cleavage/methylation domain-containing protein